MSPKEDIVLTAFKASQFDPGGVMSIAFFFPLISPINWDLNVSVKIEIYDQNAPFQAKGDLESLDK